MLSLVVSLLLIVIIDRSTGDPNECKTGAGNTVWRCAKVTISGEVSYHWACCKPERTDGSAKNCGYYDLGQMGVDVDLSKDEITVNKNTWLNDDWGSCDSKTLCKMAFSVRKYELIKGCDKSLHDKEGGVKNHYKSTVILRKKKKFKPLTRLETKKLREAVGKEIGPVSDYASETHVLAIKHPTIYMAKQNGQNTYKAYNDDDRESETNSFVLFCVALGACVLLIGFCLICFIVGGLIGFISGRYYSQSNCHKVENENTQIV